MIVFKHSAVKPFFPKQKKDLFWRDQKKSSFKTLFNRMKKKIVEDRFTFSLRTREKPPLTFLCGGVSSLRNCILNNPALL